MIEYIALIASVMSLGVSIIMALYVSKEWNNLPAYRNDLFEINRNLAALNKEAYEDNRKLESVDIDLRKIIMRFNQLEEKVIGNKDAEKPYSILVTFSNPRNNRRIDNVVSHDVKYKNGSDSFIYSIYIEHELHAYKKGDESGNPSVRIKLEDYVSIEVIKEEAE